MILMIKGKYKGYSYKIYQMDETYEDDDGKLIIEYSWYYRRIFDEHGIQLEDNLDIHHKGEDIIHLWIDLGCPSRGIGNWTFEELMEINCEK